MKGQKITGIRHNYFDEIDTPIKAYLLGFFLADGCIEKNHCSRYCISFSQKELDIGILQLVQGEISPNSNITEASTQKGQFRIRIMSTPIAERLFSLGIPMNRTYNNFSLPLITKEFERDMIRGFFDGDGTANTYVNKSHTTLRGKISFVRQVRLVSNTYKVLQDLSVILSLEGINHSYRKHGKYFYLSIRGYREWYNYLYPGITMFPRKQQGCQLCTLTSSELESLKAIKPCNA